MLLDIIIIVLRETLEASILVAVLLSVSKHHEIRFTWVAIALSAGLIGAVIYGSGMGDVSEWFEYAGQEVVNASLQISIYFLIAVLIPIQWLGLANLRRLLRNLMAIIVFMALVREGAELYIFYGGFLQKDGALLEALTSGFVGLTVGLSIGAIVFYSLVMTCQSKVKLLHAGILVLVSAGMVLQATQLLIQVDWLPSSEPLWDSNWLITESSVFGQMAYAIFGYESTPSATEVGAYGIGLLGLSVVATLVIRLNSNKRDLVERS